MKLLQDLARKLDVLPGKLPGLIKSSVERHEPEFEAANKGQLYDGLRADGTEIEPPYTAATVRIKLFKGQIAGRVTLKDTGAFWDSIGVEVTTTSLAMVATDEKTQKLLAKYGPLALGLSDEAVEFYKRRQLLPELRDGVRAHFHR